MIVNFGKHRGKSVGALVLKEPAYIAWSFPKAIPVDRLEVSRLRLSDSSGYSIQNHSQPGVMGASAANHPLIALYI